MALKRFDLVCLSLNLWINKAIIMEYEYNVHFIIGTWSFLSNIIIWNNKAFISIFLFFCAKYMIIYYWWSTKLKGVERLASCHWGHLWLKRSGCISYFGRSYVVCKENYWCFCSEKSDSSNEITWVFNRKGFSWNL